MNSTVLRSGAGSSSTAMISLSCPRSKFASILSRPDRAPVISSDISRRLSRSVSTFWRSDSRVVRRSALGLRSRSIDWLMLPAVFLRSACSKSIVRCSSAIWRSSAFIFSDATFSVSNCWDSLSASARRCRACSDARASSRRFGSSLVTASSNSGMRDALGSSSFSMRCWSWRT